MPRIGQRAAWIAALLCVTGRALAGDPLHDPSTAPYDCGYREPPVWQQALDEAVHRGEVPWPRAPRLPAAAKALPPAPDLPQCLTPAQIFPFEDSEQLLLAGFSDGQLSDLMTQAANALIVEWGDHYDFIGFWLNFAPRYVIGPAFYMGIANDVTGLGRDPFDRRTLMGLAAGRHGAHVQQL